MESFKQKRANLLNDNPIASHGSWISKHSIAAGSPLHQGGSYKQSPLDQEKKIQNIDSEDTSANVYKTSGVGFGGRDSFNVVQNKTAGDENPYTEEQLGNRIDVKTGNALDYNSTHGTVELKGGEGSLDPKPYKNVNLENSNTRNSSSISAAELKNQTDNQLNVTNREFNTNTWSSQNKRNFPKQTTSSSSPKSTYENKKRKFNTNRKNDSTSIMNKRNFASKSVELDKKGKKLSKNIIGESQALEYLRSL